MFVEKFKVDSPNVNYTENEIHSVYNYETTELVHENRNGSYQWIVKPKTIKYEFKTHTHVPKLGVMLVGWGGNNGSTLTAGVIANRESVKVGLGDEEDEEEEVKKERGLRGKCIPRKKKSSSKEERSEKK